MTDHVLKASVVALAGATAMVDAARREAVARGVRVSVAVLDRGGHLVAFSRMDGIHPGTVAVAIAKARTALLYNRPSEAFASGLSGGNAALLSLPEVTAFPGGLPIAGSLGASGAIGVSGAAPDVDEAIAQAGRAALSGG